MYVCTALVGVCPASATQPNQEEVFLNLVLDFVPENLHDFNRSFMKQRGEPMPMLYIKVRP